MNQPTPTPKIPDDINYRILSADGCYELCHQVHQATHNTGWQPIGGIAILPPNPNEARPGDPYPPVYFQAVYRPTTTKQPNPLKDSFRTTTTEQPQQSQQPTPIPQPTQPPLSACPFCNHASPRVCVDPSYDKPIHYVRCPGCAARGPECYTHSAARHTWNYRATKPTNSTSRIEAQWEAIVQRTYTTLADRSTPVTTAVQLYEGILRYESGERTATLYDLLANT